MNLAFTICSINYLAQAATLGNSLKATNPDWKFVIGLVDRLDKAMLDTDKLPDFEMIEIHQIDIRNFDWMCKNYDITELNTAVKPFLITHLFKHNPSIQNVFYFDPDIIVYQPLNELVEDLTQNNIVITPHLTKPLHDKDRKSPNEAIHLTTGIYNLGFIGMHRSVETSRFVQWWEDKLTTECKIDLENGLFVDQKWVNFAPIYFDKVLINRYLGYNVAYWNLHEREISKENERWLINEKYPLRFFHFSGYLLNKPSEISKYQNRFNFAERQDLLPIFIDYGKRLRENHNEYFQQFPCYYIKPKQLIYYQSLRKIIKYPLSILLAFLEKIELKYYKYETPPPYGTYKNMPEWMKKYNNLGNGER